VKLSPNECLVMFPLSAPGPVWERGAPRCALSATRDVLKDGGYCVTAASGREERSSKAQSEDSCTGHEGLETGRPRQLRKNLRIESISTARDT